MCILCIVVACDISKFMSFGPYYLFRHFSNSVSQMKHVRQTMPIFASKQHRFKMVTNSPSYVNVFLLYLNKTVVCSDLTHGCCSLIMLCITPGNEVLQKVVQDLHYQPQKRRATEIE